MAIRNIVPLGKKGEPARREEYDPFALFRQEMNRLFDSFFQGVDSEASGRHLSTFAPNVDVLENDREFKISAELPGMDEKDIDVTLSKDSLTIKGEKKEEKEDKGKDYYRMERSYGSFSRTVQFPVEVNTEKVEAHFRKGVLTIAVPKTEKARKETKKIPVQSE